MLKLMLVMDSSEHKNSPLSPIDDETYDEDILDFIHRWEVNYEQFKTEKDTLTELYQHGKYDELNEEIDNLADEMATKSTEFTDNITLLRELQGYRNPDTAAIKELVGRQKELYANYRSWIVMESGLPDDVRFSEIEKSKNNVADTLTQTYPSGEFTPNDALVTIGIISYDKDDKKVYRFPEELVPESTNELWKTYLAAVCNHVKTQRDLSNHVIDDKSALEQADKTRTYAHNAITKDLNAILGFEGNQNWEFKDTRQLVAHIRDQVFSSEHDPLSSENLALIRHQSAGLSAIDCLCAAPLKSR